MLCAFACMSVDFCQRRIALPFYYYICFISQLNYSYMHYVLSWFVWQSLSLSLSLSRMNMAMPVLFHLLTSLLCIENNPFIIHSQSKMSLQKKPVWSKYFITTEVFCYSIHNRSTWSWRSPYARFYQALGYY